MNIFSSLPLQVHRTVKFGTIPQPPHDPVEQIEYHLDQFQKTGEIGQVLAAQNFTEELDPDNPSTQAIQAQLDQVLEDNKPAPPATEG